jgi:hypothetical protein
LRWRYDGDPRSVTACNCSICRRYGALWLYGWKNDVVHTTGPSTAYTRGAAIAFHFCPTWGCVAYYHALKDDERGRTKMAINVRMVETPEKVTQLPINRFDGLDSFDDLPDDHRLVADMWS